VSAQVSIVVATFGDESYRELAERVAIPSAEATGCPVIPVHGDSIHGARNTGLAQVETPWVIYLDSDDQLEPGYVDAMLAGTGDVRPPRVRYVTPGQQPPAPVMPKVVNGPRHRRHPACTQACLPDGNWIIIGALARTQLLRDIGGWRDLGWEDWDCWLRCHLAGATITPCPDAIYRANRRPNSRGGYTAAESLAHHRAVAAANGVPSP
jgi:glycosyltransferase involved in cell wall biosynthesis